MHQEVWMALFPYEDPIDPRSVDVSEEKLKRVLARFQEQHKAGVFSHLAFGDSERELAVGIVTNGSRSFIDFARRLPPLSHGLRRACD
jgi:hypothetical protein